MFGFIAFGFKLIFAAIAGGALSYIPGEETQNHKIVETSLICIFGAAILGLTSQLHIGEYNIVTGIGILAVIIGRIEWFGIICTVATTRRLRERKFLQPAECI